MTSCRPGRECDVRGGRLRQGGVPSYLSVQDGVLCPPAHRRALRTMIRSHVGYAGCCSRPPVVQSVEHDPRARESMTGPSARTDEGSPRRALSPPTAPLSVGYALSPRSVGAFSASPVIAGIVD